MSNPNNHSGHSGPNGPNNQNGPSGPNGPNNKNKSNKSSLQSQAVGTSLSRHLDQETREESLFYNGRSWSELVPVPKNCAQAYVYACSPRPNGNTDFASMLVMEELDELGVSYDDIFLREYKLTSCGGCQKCGEQKNGICNLSTSDDTQELFNPLLGAQSLFFVAPIYFYHLPAQFKAFIDRSQAYWVQYSLGSPVMHGLPKRKAYTILLCAREKGEKIFQGSLLSLRFFLAPFNIELAEPLLLRNLDRPGDLAARPDIQEQILNYTRQAFEHA